MSDNKEEDTSAIVCEVAGTANCPPPTATTTTCNQLTDPLRGASPPPVNSAVLQAAAAAITHKRYNSQPISDLCASTENKPLSYQTKRQRTKSATEQMETSSNIVHTLERHEHINGIAKKPEHNGSSISQLCTQNPLSERNIRVENDILSKTTNYDKISSKLPNVAIINNSTIPVTPIINNESKQCNNSDDMNSKRECEPLSLTSAITSLDNSHRQRSPSTSTLDYVAQLPDGCTRQHMEAIDDVSSTPPHTTQHNLPSHQLSGDEDDDNYLDSSEDEEEDADAGTNNEEDESCGEDDSSVVSTVGSTCSLRSVASEALAAICRNDRGQTTNEDGSLLYNCPPSSLPVPAFSPSLFSHVPPALRFCQHNEQCQPLPECVARLLKWRHTAITPAIIRKTVTNSNYKMTKRTLLWSGTWGKHMKSTCFKVVRSYQKVNHFPGTFQIGRKDKLWKNFVRLQAKFGKEEFGFMPKTFVLPAEVKALRTAFDKEGVKKKWIIKPPASARGTGIQVVDKWSQLDTNTPLVVQRYISRPYLINNTKFDLRIYVLVTSFHPLRVYLYQDGLVRFASVEYRNESTTLSDRFMHLTNYSVNKTNSSYTHNTEAGQCQGHRWTLCTLWGYLKAQGVDTGALWSRIADMVIKTVLSGEQDIIVRARKHVRSKYSCFELFGFDVLLDERLRPWLLEVNISPSLHSACSLDYMVKGPLMAYLLTTAAFHVPDHRSLTSQMQTEVLTEFGLADKVSRLTLDHRIYTRLLTEEEQAKHVHINALPRGQYLTAALASLTPDDVRHLVLGEDELQRAGKFTCIFPTPETHRYFGFVDRPRYYNRLWDAWETAYAADRSKGVERLQQLCAEKFHLIVPPKFKMPKVVGAPLLSKATGSEDSISLMLSSSGTATEALTTTITSTTTSTTSTVFTDISTTANSANQSSEDKLTSSVNSISESIVAVTQGNPHEPSKAVESCLLLNKCVTNADTNTNGTLSERVSVGAEHLVGTNNVLTESGTSSLTGSDSSSVDATAATVCKRPRTANRGSNKCKVRRKKYLHLKLNPKKPAENNHLMNAAMVAGGRGNACIVSVVDEQDDEDEYTSSDGEDTCERDSGVDCEVEKTVKIDCDRDGEVSGKENGGTVDHSEDIQDGCDRDSAIKLDVNTLVKCDGERTLNNTKHYENVANGKSDVSSNETVQDDVNCDERNTGNSGYETCKRSDGDLESKSDTEVSEKC